MISSKTDKKKSDSLNEDFIGRWSRRKQQALLQQKDASKIAMATPDTIDAPQLTDADMPPIDSLTEDSDYSGFLSPKVSEALRKQALRKLFHSPAFNICDGLDDYDGDYTSFEKLGDLITADMKHQIEMEAQRHMQELTEAEAIETTENNELATVPPSDNVDDTSAEILAKAEIEANINDQDNAEVEQ